MKASSTAEQLCRRFSLAEIQSATEDFSDAHVIGKGGFGKVYKGLIDNGSLIVAIKRRASSANQGETEFVTEMETLTKLRHRNLVSLIGYCDEQGEMILVYEYMANGTLADHLYKLSRDSNEGSSLTWLQRLKICIGAGRGLDYLHSGSSIIHRDVKSTNILLDQNFVAKISDFGLAKHLSIDNFESHVSASLKGSFGYFDPSYFITGRLTRASDTYAFGVVLLEVVSERPAVGRRLDDEDELCLTMWAQEKIRNGKAEQIVSSNLRGEISEDCLKIFAGVVKRCLHHEPKKRLTMTQVVAQLELALEQQERKGPTRKLQFRPLNAFWKRVIPSGTTQKDDNKVEVDMLPGAIPAIKEEALEYKQTVDLLPHAIPSIEVDELEDEKNVNMQSIVAPAIPVDELLNEQNVDMLLIEVPAFPLAEIKEITDDFSSECLISNGYRKGGLIFHGVLRSGRGAAVKKLPKNLSDEEFLEEVSAISSLKHENMVELLGYCLDDGLHVLVYEFAPRGSLYDILNGRKDINGIHLEPGPTLSWAQRIEIAIGAAKGLLYIHDKALIHRNIRSSNVLLFDDEIAKITDPHLLTEGPCKEVCRYVLHPSRSSVVCGYHPPEYRWVGPSQKGDVYSCGVVLLELLTGQKVFDRARRKPLVTWATPMLGEAKVMNIVDARLKENFPLKAVVTMAAIAALCLQYEADFRPDMSEVTKGLQAISRVTRDYLLKKQHSQS